MKVSIGFSKARSKWAFLSTTLQWYMQTPYSHVFIEFEDHGIPMVYQASKSMVHAVALEHFIVDNKVVKSVDLEVSDDVYLDLLKAHKLKLGFKYDKLQLFGIWWATAFGQDHNKFRLGNKDYICSELVAKTLQKLGYIIDKDINLVTPKDVERYLAQGRG